MLFMVRWYLIVFQFSGHSIKIAKKVKFKHNGRTCLIRHETSWFLCGDILFKFWVNELFHTIEFGEIPKIYRQVEQAGQLGRHRMEYTADLYSILMQSSNNFLDEIQHLVHFNMMTSVCHSQFMLSCIFYHTMRITHFCIRISVCLIFLLTQPACRSLKFRQTQFLALQDPEINGTSNRFI